jgi:bacterioferritin
MGKKGQQLVHSHGIKVPELIKLLNRALSDEWLAYYQYWVGAKIALGVPRGEVVEELEQHAKEELEHAEMLAERIVQLGGTPVLSPKEWYDLTNHGYLAPKDPSLEALLDQNIRTERGAIHVYETLVEMTRGKDFVTYDLAMEILKKEVEHEEDLEALKRDLEACCKK